MNKNTSNEILKILEEIIIDPKPELNFRNNYELICAVILSAQTKDKNVNVITKDLFVKYPDFNHLSKASFDELEEMIRPIGLSKAKANNLISMANEIISTYNGEVPSSFEELVKLPGVGRKTANVVLALGFNIPAIPVDTHLHRMAKRLGYIKAKDDVIKAEEAYKKYIPKDSWIKAHHLFLLYGRYYCLSSSPKCADCKLKKYCKEKR